MSTFRKNALFCLEECYIKHKLINANSTFIVRMAQILWDIPVITSKNVYFIFVMFIIGAMVIVATVEFLVTYFVLKKVKEDEERKLIKKEYIRVTLTIGLCFLMVIGMVLMGACEEKVPTVQYDFPIEKTVADTVLEQVGLPWVVEDPQSFWEGHGSYFMVDEEGFLRTSLDTTETESIKNLSVVALRVPEKADKSIQKEVEVQDEPKLVELGIKLFGKSVDSVKLYNEAQKEISKRTAGNGVLYEKVIDDTYYSLTFVPNKNSEGYYFRKLEINNKASYEAFKDSQGSIWFLTMSKYIEPKEGIKTDEILSENCLTKVNGVLTNLKKLDEKSMFDGIRIDGEEYVLDNEDYMKGTLSNDSGEIEVLVKKFALSEADLKEERTHVAYYLAKNEIPIVELSVIEGSEQVWLDEIRNIES